MLQNADDDQQVEVSSVSACYFSQQSLTFHFLPHQYTIPLRSIVVFAPVFARVFVVVVFRNVTSSCCVLQFVNPDVPGYVGFANLPNQVHRKSVKKGFEFTLMVVGKSRVTSAVGEERLRVHAHGCR